MFVLVYIHHTSWFYLSSSGSHSNNTRDTHAKNIFCFNNNIMNDNSKQDHPGKNKFGCPLFPEIRGHYPARISRLFWIYPKKSPFKSSDPKKYLPKIPE